MFTSDVMRNIGALLLADTIDVFITKLEAFADHFEYLASSEDQRELASRFKAFVEATIQSLLSPGMEMGHPAPNPEEKAIHKQHGHETLAGLFAEIRADEAAGKLEDAHWYGKLSLKEMRSGLAETPAGEKSNDKSIEK
jgi:hypothetical protein